MLLQQDAASLYHVLGFGFVQADALNIYTQLFFAKFEYRLRCIGKRIKLPSGGIYADVGGLRREHHRHQQFKWRVIFQLGGGMRIRCLQPQENFFPLGWVHYTAGMAVLGIALAFSSARRLSQLRAAMSKPSVMNAPGGKMASKKP
mgnify:CR=1 FL=1